MHCHSPVTVCLSLTMWYGAAQCPDTVNQISAVRTVGSRYRLRGPRLIYKQPRMQVYFHWSETSPSLTPTYLHWTSMTVMIVSTETRGQSADEAPQTIRVLYFFKQTAAASAASEGSEHPSNRVCKNPFHLANSNALKDRGLSLKKIINMPAKHLPKLPVLCMQSICLRGLIFENEEIKP